MKGYCNDDESDNIFNWAGIQRRYKTGQMATSHESFNKNRSLGGGYVAIFGEVVKKTGDRKGIWS